MVTVNEVPFKFILLYLQRLVCLMMAYEQAETCSIHIKAKT